MIGVAVVMLVIGAIGGTAAMRIVKKIRATGPARSRRSRSNSRRPTSRASRRSRSRAGCPVSGTVQPVHQATVKAKVSGDVRQVTVREGESVQAGQLLARIDTADLESKLLERIGALESAKAQLALAEKTRATNQALLKQNFISQNAFDNSESSFSVSQGSVKSAEAQVQLARNALRDAIVTSPLAGIVAKRHVQPGEKVAFDSPLVTVVDLKDLELQAMVPAVDVPELAIGMTVELTIDGFGERQFSGRIERINPATEPGTRAILVYVGIPNRGRRAARRHVRDRPHRARGERTRAPTLPATAIRTEAGQTYVWTIDERQARRAQRRRRPPRRRRGAGRGQDRAARRMPMLAARFDNLKEGAPALVKAPPPPCRHRRPPQCRRRARRRPPADAAPERGRHSHVDHPRLDPQSRSSRPW